MTWPKTSRRRRQLPADWPDIRSRILTRDGLRCTWIDNGIRCPNRATDVDHVRNPHDHSDANLQSLCGKHHDRKTAAEGVRARGHGASLRRPADPHPSRGGG